MGTWDLGGGVNFVNGGRCNQVLLSTPSSPPCIFYLLLLRPPLLFLPPPLLLLVDLICLSLTGPGDPSTALRIIKPTRTRGMLQEAFNTDK